MASNFVRGWQRGNLANIGVTPESSGAVYATDTELVGGTSNATPNNLLIGVFALRAGNGYTFGTVPAEWQLVGDLNLTTANIKIIVCHRIATGTSSDNFSMSWTGSPSTRYWYGAIAEYSGVNALDKLQRWNSNVTLVSTSSTSINSGTADLVTDGQVISILALNDERYTGMAIAASPLVVDYNTDLTANTGSFPKAIFGSAVKNAALAETATWSWSTVITGSLAIVITYGNSGGATVPDW
jgi:hypothetical protein